MKPFIDSILKQYWLACDVLAQNFATKYFGKDTERWWVADEPGGVYFINDYFFDMREMAEFVQYKYTRKEMFEYKNKQIERAESGMETQASIKWWKKFNKEQLKK